MTSFRRKRLGDILVAKGVVTQAQITEILSKTNDRQKRIGEVLEAEGLITEEVLAQALAEQRDLRYLDLTGFRIAPQLLEEVPADLMHRYRFVPIEDAGDLLVVAVTDPTNIPAIDELEMALKRPVCVVRNAEMYPPWDHPIDPSRFGSTIPFAIRASTPLITSHMSPTPRLRTFRARNAAP